ncbi:hypothetical protein HF520_07475 [Romboutsia sp. CE17]|uniref:Na+/H+ antiporter NhaC family protein n=1 Tax=Romboutsia sp. CE17 TaxID=2724150 RepID=UPI001442DB0B|nr:hypothetical protein HF520_07475 [Romboutsia sp. CE17]
MRKAEIRARKGEKEQLEVAIDSTSEHSDLGPKEGVKLNIWNAIIPIGTLIISDLVAFYSSGYSSIMAGENATLIQLFKDAPLSFTAFLLPSIIFILGSIISFATGTYYGTMGILMLLAIPLAYSINPDMSYIVVSTSAVLTGAIFYNLIYDIDHIYRNSNTCKKVA